MKVAGRWRCVYRAVYQCGQIIDVYVSAKRATFWRLGASKRGLFVAHGSSITSVPHPNVVAGCHESASFLQNQPVVIGLFTTSTMAQRPSASDSQRPVR